MPHILMLTFAELRFGLTRCNLLIFVTWNLYFQLTFFVFSFLNYLTSHLKIE